MTTLEAPFEQRFRNWFATQDDERKQVIRGIVGESYVDPTGQGRIWHICPTCGLAGPAKPGETYCLTHRPKP